MPKHLLPVLDRPFADHQLTWLANQGVTHVLYCVAHMADRIRSYVQDGSKWNLSVDYADEGEVLQGTAGALRSAMQQGLLPDRFLLLYGDSYLPIDYVPVWKAFEESGCPALMTVFRNDDRWESSNVVYESGRIVLYDKSRQHPLSVQMRYIDYGLSALRRDVIEEQVPTAGPADLANVFHRLSAVGQLAGFEVGDRFYEVGSPQGLKDLERHFLNQNLRQEGLSRPTSS